ncbi:MAG: DNA translocase FtsK 4TM domain-containing protein, partial [Xanthomonadales bacterium]|nr:DNA translocase FtsK 4TM domain-containing protein [Xanthomonadales bacterium]
MAKKSQVAPELAASASPALTSSLSARLQQMLRESVVVLALPVALYLFACFWTFDPSDPGWSHAGSQASVHNLGGRAGAWLADLGLYLVGKLVYLLPLALMYFALRIARPGPTPERDPAIGLLAKAGGLILTLLAGTVLGHLHGGDAVYSPPAGGGGVLGAVVGQTLVPSLGFGPTTMFALALFLVGVTFATGLSWFRVVDGLGALALRGVAEAGAAVRRLGDWWAGRRARAEREEVRKVETRKQVKREKPRIEPVAAPIEKSERAEREVQMPLFDSIPSGPLPPLSLLDEPRVTGKGYSPEALEAL